MNTQTHMIMGAVIFGKPLPRLAWFGVAGGILPDLPMFIIVAGLRAQGVSLEKIFGEYYWQPWWQIANAIGHNFWLWSLLLSFQESASCEESQQARPTILVMCQL